MVKTSCKNFATTLLYVTKVPHGCYVPAMLFHCVCEQRRQSCMMSFLFRKTSSRNDKSHFLSSSKSSKNKLPQSSIHFLKKVQSIQGVIEAYASDKKTTFVKLENQRIICLRGHNANPLYEHLREMYIAQENEQYLNYLQGSRSSATSSTERSRQSYTFPEDQMGVSCSDNIKDYMMKRKYKGRRTPTLGSRPNSLVSGSQSSLDGTTLRRKASGASTSKLASEKIIIRRKSGIASELIEDAHKHPLMQKALANLKRTDSKSYNNYNAAILQIDEYMRNTFNLDFANLFAHSQALRSRKANGGDDEDDDDGSLEVPHQALRQYENLPYKHFPPLTSHSDESGEEGKNTVGQDTESEAKDMGVDPELEQNPREKEQHLQRRSSAPGEQTRSRSRENKKSSALTPSARSRHTICDPQKESRPQRFIKVYRPGHSRPIFISGATTLGGLPEPAPRTQNRLSERLKHKPTASTSSRSGDEQSNMIMGSCPVMVEVSEIEERLAAGYGQKVSLSETFLARRKHHAERRPTFARVEVHNGEACDTYLDTFSPGDLTSPKYDTSFQLESSLQDANDLVRTLFDNLSIGAPVLASASGSVDPSFGTVESTATTQNPHAVVVSVTASPIQKSREGSSETDSIPSASSNSDSRKTV